MKTLEELYGEVRADEALTEEFFRAGADGKVEEFLRAHGCGAAAQEAEAFLAERDKRCGASGGELSDDELDDVAAGKKCGVSYDSEGRPIVGYYSKCGSWRDQDGGGIPYNTNWNYQNYTVRCGFCYYWGGGVCLNPRRKNN